MSDYKRDSHAVEIFDRLKPEVLGAIGSVIEREVEQSKRPLTIEPLNAGECEQICAILRDQKVPHTNVVYWVWTP